MRKSGKRDTQRAALTNKTAEIMGVSPRYVRMVINGERNDEAVLVVYMELKEGGNRLVEAVKKLVPFE